MAGRRMTRWRSIPCAVCVVATALVATPAHAQVLRGIVRERETKVPVVGAAVVVRDSARQNAGFARTDEDGAFFLNIPVTGFSVRIVRVGFAPESLSTGGLAAADTTDVVVEMQAIVTRLSPVVVEGEKREIRASRVMGLNLKAMSTHIITPSEIAAASRGARSYLDALRTALPAGVMVSDRNQCVSMARGALIDARTTCAMIFVDGVRVPDASVALDLVQPQWLDHAIFVRATDAGMRFGTGAAGGVLLLFTKFGGYALDPP